MAGQNVFFVTVGPEPEGNCPRITRAVVTAELQEAKMLATIMPMEHLSQ